MTIGPPQLLCALGMVSFLLGFVARRQTEETDSPPAESSESVPIEFRQTTLEECRDAYLRATNADTFQSTHLAEKEEALWQWITLDGDQAFAHAQQTHNGTRWDLTDSPNSILQRWAWRAPKAAMRAALQIEDRDERNRTLGSILDRLTVLDELDAAITTATQLEELGDTGRVFLEAWALEDPEAAGKWFGQLRHPANVGVGWTHQLPTSMVLHAFEAMHDRWGRSPSIDHDVTTVLAQILEGEASESPKAALKWLTRLSPALLDDRLLHAVVRGWASRSPVDTLAFIETLPKESTDLQEKSLIELARAWSQSDPKNAARWILSQPEETQEPLLNVAAEHFVEHDLAWANEVLQVGGEEEHPEVVGEFVTRLAEESPETAAARLLDHIDNPSYVGPFSELGKTWHAADPKRCALFVSSLPPGPNRDAAASGIIAYLLEYPSSENLDSAQSWISTMQPGPTRAALVTTLEDARNSEAEEVPTQ